MTIEKIKEKLEKINQRIERQEKKAKNNKIRKARSKRKRLKSNMQNYSIGVNMVIKDDFNRQTIQKIIMIEKKLKKELQNKE